VDASSIKAFELILVFGLVIGWGVWELWSLRRDRRRREDQQRRRDSGDPAGPAASRDRGAPD
jgi:heme/copper-type cytochrome/quinol oxidase subunit 2